MRSRVGKSHQSISLFLLGALLSLSPPSWLKAQPNNRDPSCNGFQRSQTARIVSAASGKSWDQVKDERPLIVNADLVTLDVSVVDGWGRAVTGLDKRAFTILDDKVTQEITFFSDADAPVSVSVVFDLSGSMSREKIKRAREALGHFIETSSDSDEYTLIGFNERPQVLLKRTRDGMAMIDKLSAPTPHGATALYDACYLGIESLARGAYPKRVLLLISDGQDNNSRYNLEEVRQLLRESGVVLYSIGIADPIQLHGKAGSQVRYTLEGLADITGGKTFYVSNGKMDAAFEQIALELRHQYSIGYRPRVFTLDGKWHRIKVKVTAPAGTTHLSVRTKTGYYAVAR